MKPEPGGIYAYIRDAFGPLPRLPLRLGAVFVIGSGSVATLTVAFPSYLREFINLRPIGSKIVAVVVIAMLAVINVRARARARASRTGRPRSRWPRSWRSAPRLLATGNGLSWTSGAVVAREAGGRETYRS